MAPSLHVLKPLHKCGSVVRPAQSIARQFTEREADPHFQFDEDDEWRDASLLTSLRAKGIICCRVGRKQACGGNACGQPVTHARFTEEDHQVYLQISQQTS